MLMYFTSLTLMAEVFLQITLGFPPQFAKPSLVKCGSHKV
jgi:hypothetical protein